MKLFKWLAGIVVTLVALVAVGGYLLLSSLDLEQARGLVQDEARMVTGRDLVLSGPIDLGLSWTPSIRIEQVTFANAPWGSRPAMAALDRFELELALMPLLSGDLQVRRVVLVGADILLEKGADGAVNWSFDEGVPAEPTERDGMNLVPRIDSVVIEASRVTYRDGATGADLALTVDRAEVTAVGSNLAVDMAGSYQAVPFTLAGEIGGPAAFGADAPFPVKLTGRVAGAELTLDGTIADLAGAPTPSLAFRIAGTDVAALAPLAGAELPELGPYELSGSLTGDGTAWSIASLQAKMGGSDLTGDATIALGGERPRIDANLTSTLLALADFGAAPAAAAVPAEDSPYVIPDTPLPLNALRGVDAGVTVAIAKLVPAAGIEVADVALTLTLEGGALTIDPFTASYGSGVASGRLALDGAAEIPSLALAATIDDLDFGRLLAEQGVSDEVKGTVDIAVDLAGQGASPRAIAASLDGTTELIAENGVITNKILAIVATGLTDILGPLFGGEEQTTLNCALSRFDIAGGVATSRSLLLDTSTFSLAGSGTVDLRDESLDLHFDTSSRQTALVSLAVPFNVKGTMKTPQVAPDPLGTAIAAAKLAGTAVDPMAVLGAMVAVDQTEAGGGNACVAVEQQAQEDSGAFGLPGVEGTAGAVQEKVEDVIEGVGGDAGAAVEGAGEAVEDAVEGLQNLLGD